LALFTFSALSLLSIAITHNNAPLLDEQTIIPFLKKNNYTNGISGYYVAQKIMFYSNSTIAVSSLGGPFFITRFLDVERLISGKGA
jgi:hypothetical protein